MEGKYSERRENLYNNIIATCAFINGQEIIVLLFIIAALWFEDIFKIASFYVVFKSIYTEFKIFDGFYHQMGKETYQRVMPEETELRLFGKNCKMMHSPSRQFKMRILVIQKMKLFQYQCTGN